jgi:hypothetical protein
MNYCQVAILYIFMQIVIRSHEVTNFASGVNVYITRLPVRWDKTVIVVMNEVRVGSPYLAECVSGGTPAANDRVKKVVRH